eukprot:TRINITY_DN13609_c0_g1_i1.p1 TRINITY_DN13609_c0_g1~~TRINITY_DN13609_c0_g1_i1.p1  ORF type:complete len:825 (+),score=177.06 TRINITY_DN13609_c0_g1_i1:36-2510(+)
MASSFSTRGSSGKSALPPSLTPPALPVVLGNRGCAESHEGGKSPASSLYGKQEQLEQADLEVGPTYTAERISRTSENAWTSRKYSIGARTVLQLSERSCREDTAKLLAPTILLLSMTVVFTIFIAPRDHHETIAWRFFDAKEHGRDAQAPGCTAADYSGFYSIVLCSLAAGLASCFLFRNSAGSMHILSASGYAAMNWLQGLAAAAVPAHERMKDGCAYGIARASSSPVKDISYYESPEYFQEYYGVIAVRAFLFLLGLIWMQQLVVQRVIALEISSRAHFGAGCLSFMLMLQRIVAGAAFIVSVWTYAAIGSPENGVLGSYTFDSSLGESYGICLFLLQICLGSLALLLFLGSVSSMIVILYFVSHNIGKAAETAKRVSAGHARAEAAARQLQRARGAALRQLFGVSTSLVTSTATVPSVVQMLLAGRGYSTSRDLAIGSALQAFDILTSVLTALILSGGYRSTSLPMKAQGSLPLHFQPCWQEVPCRMSTQPSEVNRSVTCSSVAWAEKVAELAGRGITLEELLQFYRQLGSSLMPHYKASVHTTSDVVRQAIIPTTRATCSAYAGAKRPDKMVTHCWGNRFVDLVAAIVADALEESSFGLIARLLEKDIGIIEGMLRTCKRLTTSYWICAFCVNQHTSVCDNVNGTTDSVTGQAHPVCDCGLQKFHEGDQCEMNKFDEMMSFLAARDKFFSQVVAVDADFTAFGRAWCVAELAQASSLGMQQHLKLRSKEGLMRAGIRLRGLDVREMKASRQADADHILAKIPDKDEFNSTLQNLIFDDRAGLLASWRELDSSRQMSEAGRLIFWNGADADTGIVWKCWDF